MTCPRALFDECEAPRCAGQVKWVATSTDQHDRAKFMDDVRAYQEMTGVKSRGKAIHQTFDLAMANCEQRCLLK